MSSTWNEIRSGLDGMAKKINQKADELSTVAALRIKIAATRADLEAEYTELGRLVYAAKVEENGEDEIAQERITACMSRIAALNESIALFSEKLERQD